MEPEDFCSEGGIARQRWPTRQRRRTPPRNPSQMRTRMQSDFLGAFPLAATARPRSPRASRCTLAPGATRTARETKLVRQLTPQELKLARLTPTLRSEKSRTTPRRTATSISKPRTKIHAQSDSKIVAFSNDHFIRENVQSMLVSQASGFSSVKDDVSWIVLCKVRYSGQRMA